MLPDDNDSNDDDDDDNDDDTDLMTSCCSGVKAERSWGLARAAAARKRRPATDFSIWEMMESNKTKLYRM